jgi:hypothetical protein
MRWNQRATRRSLDRRGRRALLYGVASFVALQLGLAVAIERWMPDLRDPTYGIKLRLLNRRMATVTAKPPTVVVVGTSRVEYGLLGQALEEQLAPTLGVRPVVFNFGVSGAGGVYELLVVHRLVAQGIRPDIMLIEIFCPYFGVKRGPFELTRLTPERLWRDELPLVARCGGSLPELETEWWQGWPAPCYSHRHAILSRTVPVFLPGNLDGVSSGRFDASGMGPAFPSPQSPEERRAGFAAATTGYGEWLEGFELGGPSPLALREILELCRRERIATALMLMPEAPEFRALYSPQAWAQIESYLARLSVEFDATLINARDWAPADEFADGQHLIAPGAARFTERLGREHLAPLLAGTRWAHR